MKKIYQFAVIFFLSTCRVNTILAQSGFEPVINGVVNDTINNMVIELAPRTQQIETF